MIALAAARAAESGNAIELEDLSVDPDWTSRGIGRLLMLDLETFAKARGVRRIEVTVNPHALGFYRELGYAGEVEMPSVIRRTSDPYAPRPDDLTT